MSLNMHFFCNIHIFLSNNNNHFKRNQTHSHRKVLFKAKKIYDYSIMNNVIQRGTFWADATFHSFLLLPMVLLHLLYDIHNGCLARNADRNIFAQGKSSASPSITFASTIHMQVHCWQCTKQLNCGFIR